MRSILLAAVVVLADAVWLPATATAQVEPSEKVSLKDVLEKGLKVRFAEERLFVARVLRRVERNELPETLVKAVFKKARDRNPRFPFPYFKQMMIEVAKGQGVLLE
jgi:hypothetical protein